MAHTPLWRWSSLYSTLKICLVGGDARQIFLSSLLRADGHTVTTAALSGQPPDLSPIPEADYVLLPMPLTDRNGALFAPLCPDPVPLSQIIERLTPTQLIFGGKIAKEISALAARRGLMLRDYLLREDLAVSNAVPTAEGALQLAMELLPITIHGCQVLIAGFGRVGQCTAQRFRALGAEVTVCARSPAQLALAESTDCAALSLNELAARNRAFDLVINTVPAHIFDHTRLEKLGSPLLMELASPPGGFDLEAVQQLGLKLLSAPGLPGKVAPLTAARIIQKTIYRMLEELNLGKEGSF